jgi:chromosome segregation ATPase
MEEIQSDVQEAQFKLARQGQELGTYMSKAELLAEERDRAASQAMKTGLQCGELENQLAAERARVAELRGQLERFASTLKPKGQQPRTTPGVPRRRRRTGSKLDK